MTRNAVQISSKHPSASISIWNPYAYSRDLKGVAAGGAATAAFCSKIHLYFIRNFTRFFHRSGVLQHLFPSPAETQQTALSLPWDSRGICGVFVIPITMQLSNSGVSQSRSKWWKKIKGQPGKWWIAIKTTVCRTLHNLLLKMFTEPLITFLYVDITLCIC